MQLSTGHWVSGYSRSAHDFDYYENQWWPLGIMRDNSGTIYGVTQGIAYELTP